MSDNDGVDILDGGEAEAGSAASIGAEVAVPG